MSWKLKLLTAFAGWQGIAVIIAASAAALYGTYKGIEYKGVRKERASVVKQATKTDAQAAVRKRAAERDPDGVLTKFYRD